MGVLDSALKFVVDAATGSADSAPAEMVAGAETLIPGTDIQHAQTGMEADAAQEGAKQERKQAALRGQSGGKSSSRALGEFAGGKILQGATAAATTAATAGLGAAAGAGAAGLGASEAVAGGTEQVAQFAVGRLSPTLQQGLQRMYEREVMDDGT